MVDVTVMDQEMQTSHKRSTARLGMIAQACAFMAAPLLTAAIGLGIAKVFTVGAATGVLAASTPLLIGIFAAGALFAGASIVTNYAINKIKESEKSREVEKSVEQIMEKAHPGITHNQEVAVNVECAPKMEQVTKVVQKNKSWAEQVNNSRAEAAAASVQR